MKKVICIFLVIVLISTSLISIFFIYRNEKENIKQEEIFEKLEIIANNNDSEKFEKQEEKINIEELYKINKDIVGWLKIENSNINYPIMQTKDRPNYYLNKNFYKNNSVLGTPYIAEYCNIELSNNLIIYGHNIKGNKVFGELENYKSKEYYNNHKIIKFYTMKENAKYEIISVFKTIAYTGFPYYKFYNIRDEREFNTFINKCKELSFYNTDISAQYGDNLITLSTCEYSNKNGRLVVIAKKIV